MKSFQQLAQSAYEAWAKTTAQVSDARGRFRPPTWADLPPSAQAAWVNAARQIVAEVAAIQ